jgi:hypothetical protein
MTNTAAVSLNHPNRPAQSTGPLNITLVLMPGYMRPFSRARISHWI